MDWASHTPPSPRAALSIKNTSHMVWCVWPILLGTALTIVRSEGLLGSLAASRDRTPGRADNDPDEPLSVANDYSVENLGI